MTLGGPVSNFIGLVLKLAGTTFMSCSFICNKIGTNRLKAEEEKLKLQKKEAATQDEDILIDQENTLCGQKPAENESTAARYANSVYMWLYTIFTVAGATCNGVALIFAPAALIMPLCTLTMVITSILSWYFLNERLSLNQQLGVFLAGIGCGLAVANAPVPHEINCLDDLMRDNFTDKIFLIYLGFNLLVGAISAWKRNEHILWRFLLIAWLCSWMGMSVKANGIALNGMLSKGMRTQAFTQPALYALLLVLVVSYAVDFVQVTIALSETTVNVGVPLYYIGDILSTILGNTILFQTYKDMSVTNVVSLMCTIGVVSVAVFHIQNVEKGADLDKGAETGDTHCRDCEVD